MDARVGRARLLRRGPGLSREVANPSRSPMFVCAGRCASRSTGRPCAISWWWAKVVSSSPATGPYGPATPCWAFGAGSLSPGHAIGVSLNTHATTRTKPEPIGTHSRSVNARPRSSRARRLHRKGPDRSSDDQFLIRGDHQNRCPCLGRVDDCCVGAISVEDQLRIIAGHPQ
jgi:hypothetical protein